MTVWSRIRSWWLATVRRSEMETEMDAELRFHLEKYAEDLMRNGVAREEAMRRARLEFGGVERAKEECREARRVSLVDSLVQDLRYGGRMLRKNVAVSAAAVLTLTLGIGANTAVFSLVDEILLRPLPYRNPEQLVLVTEVLPKLGHDEVGVSAAEYFDYRDQNKSFSAMGAYESEAFNLTGTGTPLRVNAAAVSAAVFALLGVRAEVGRTFSEDEDRYGSAGVAVLSNTLWKTQYGSDPGILAKIIRLDEKSYTVLGVMPGGFEFPFDGAPLSARADLWVPIAFDPDRLRDRVNEFGVGIVARLKENVTLAQARVDVQRVAADFMQRYPEVYSGTIQVDPQAHSFTRHAAQKARPLVLLLQAAVSLVLLIACVNLANLLLAKVGQRSREMAVRGALGATRQRLLRQCLMENFLLAGLGAGGGILLALLLVNLAHKYGPADVPQIQHASLHVSALLFTVLLSLVTTLLSSVVPVWRLARVEPQMVMKESSQIGLARSSQNLQSALAIFEIAAALVLLVGGSLLLQSFARLVDVPMGFRPEHTLVVRTMFDRARYPDALKREAVQRELLSRISSVSKVQSVAIATHLPFSDTRQIGFRLEEAAPDDFHWAQNSLVTPGYFAAMGIAIVRGREFTEGDHHRTTNVAVISQTLARDFFPGQDAIGRRFLWGDRGMFTIVGIAADVHLSALDADPPPIIYQSVFQVESGASSRTAIILRLNDSDPTTEAGVGKLVEQQIWALDKDLPVYGISTLESLVSDSLARRRFTTLLVSGFAAIALTLAILGLFGVISYMVSQRRREVAIRMALGAHPTQVRWMILKRAAAIGVTGCGIGLLFFAAGSPLLRSTLYHVRLFEPLTLLGVAALLVSVVILTAYLPARGAMREDPIAALRYG